MLGAAIDWDHLVPAAAFVLGAVLATVGTLRVVRAVTATFAPYRRPGRRDHPDG